MEINIPDDQYERLNERAVAAGYADVPTLIAALAVEPINDPRGPLGEQALRQSVAELEAADASIDAGHGIDAEEVFRRIAAERGRPLAESILRGLPETQQHTGRQQRPRRAV